MQYILRISIIIWYLSYFYIERRKLKIRAYPVLGFCGDNLLRRCIILSYLSIKCDKLTYAWYFRTHYFNIHSQRWCTLKISAAYNSSRHILMRTVFLLDRWNRLIAVFRIDTQCMVLLYWKSLSVLHRKPLKRTFFVFLRS